MAAAVESAAPPADDNDAEISEEGGYIRTANHNFVRWKLGDGKDADDGIYILLKEVLDNCIDEFVMGFGKKIEVTVRDQEVIVRDYGRGIPLNKVIDCVSKINTGAKYDSKAFKKSVGLLSRSVHCIVTGMFALDTKLVIF